jgi:hypothetical protein
MNAEANTNETAANVAAPGATLAPEKATSKNAASQKKGTPKGQKAAKGAKPKATAPKAKVAKKAATKKTRTPRGEQRCEDPGADRPPEGRDLGRDYESCGVAAPQRARVPLDRQQEARA